MATQYRYGTGGGGVGRIAAQKTAQQKKKQSPGVLTRVMDVLSRGQYASAGLALGKGPKESLSYAWQGLQGRRKDTYSDVLNQRLGIHGAPAAVLGFVGDVALDPTTYVGVGLAKTGVKTGVKAAEKGLLKGLFRTGTKDTLSTGARAIVESRKLEEAAKIAGGAAKGGSTLWKPGMEVAQAAGKAGEKAAPIAAKAAEAALPGAATKGAITLKVLGKPVLKSERAYAAGAKVLRPLANSKTGDLLGRTFRTAHGLPQGIRNLERQAQGVGMQDLHDQLLDIKKVFSGTTKAQRKEIGAAVARGTVDTLDDTLRPLGEYAQKHLGILTSNPDKLDEFAERASKAAERATKHRPGTKAAAKAAKSAEYWKAKATPGYKIPKLGDLPSEVDDIADTLARGYDKHLTKQAYKSFRSAVEKKFPEHATDPEMRRLLDRTEKVFTPGTVEGREWTNLIDKVQGYWKMAVTAPNPGFHIRNMLGDTYLNYLDGVVNPSVYKRAVGVLRKTDGIAVRGGGQTLTNHDIMRLYREQGLHSKFAQTENLVGGTKSRVLDKIGEASNAREDVGRLAHFIDALGKEMRHGRNLDDAVEAAAERVRKFNIDYSDVTDMERKFKRIMPFYTFARKALPVQLEMTLTRPGRVAVLPKGKQAIERLLGVRGEGDHEPLPGIDENLPPWMRDYFNISMGNNRVRSPDLPVDLLGQYANPVKGVLGGVTPLIKGPIELATGKTVPEGFAQKASVPRYLLNQTPISRQIANYVWKDDDAAEKTGRWLVGPLASKVVTAPSKRVTDKKKSGAKKSTVKSGSYRYGGR